MGFNLKTAYNNQQKTSRSFQLSGKKVMMQQYLLTLFSLFFVHYSFTADPFDWRFAMAEKIAAENKKALELFPRIIQDWCFENPKEYHASKFIEFAYKHYKKEPVNSWDCIYNSKQLCEAHNLSPETFFIVTSTCKAIAEGLPFDQSTLYITYDPEVELANKHALIQKMPKIVADLCAQNPDGYYAQKLTSVLHPSAFRKTIQKITYNINYNVVRLFSDSHVTCISPQTVARMAQEFKELVFDKKAPSTNPYDEKTERLNLLSIVNRFPAALATQCKQNPREYYAGKLIFLAYMIENPNHTDVLTDYLQTLSYKSNAANRYYPDVIYNIKHLSHWLDESTLADQFITIFSTPNIPKLLTVPESTPNKAEMTALINKCYANLLDNCCIKDIEYRKTLWLELADARKALITMLDSDNPEQLKKLDNVDFINGHFQEIILTCPCCFEPFSNHFSDSIGGIEVKLPCKHSFCSNCLGTWQTTCPMCRANI